MISSSFHNESDWTRASSFTIGQLVLDTSWMLIPKLAVISMILVEAILGWKFFSLIIYYLDQKPYGEQTLMDIAHRTMINTIRIMYLIAIIFITVDGICLDTGDVVAKLLMWPPYDYNTMATLYIGMDPLVQLILANNPQLQVPFSDETAKWILNLILWTPMIIMNIVCTEMGFYPPSYYTLRGQKAKYPMFRHIRSGLFILAILVFVVVRIVIYRDYHRPDRDGNVPEPSRNLLNFKVMIFGTIGFMIYASVLTFKIQPYFYPLLGLVNMVIIPMVIIGTNAKLLRFAEIEKPALVWLITKVNRCRAKSSNGPTQADQHELGQLCP